MGPAVQRAQPHASKIGSIEALGGVRASREGGPRIQNGGLEVDDSGSSRSGDRGLPTAKEGSGGRDRGSRGGDQGVGRWFFARNSMAGGRSSSGGPPGGDRERSRRPWFEGGRSCAGVEACSREPTTCCSGQRRADRDAGLDGDEASLRLYVSLNSPKGASRPAPDGLGGGYDIQTIQELLGHTDVSTTMSTAMCSTAGPSASAALSTECPAFPPLPRPRRRIPQGHGLQEGHGRTKCRAFRRSARYDCHPQSHSPGRPPATHSAPLGQHRRPRARPRPDPRTRTHPHPRTGHRSARPRFSQVSRTNIRLAPRRHRPPKFDGAPGGVATRLSIPA